MKPQSIHLHYSGWWLIYYGYQNDRSNPRSAIFLQNIPVAQFVNNFDCPSGAGTEILTVTRIEGECKR